MCWNSGHCHRLLSRSVMTMSLGKCKNAVFCGVFLLFFSIGAICGVFLIKIVTQSESNWLISYCMNLAKTQVRSPWVTVFLILRPIMIVLAVGIIPGGYRFLPVLIFLRGCLTAYSAAACHVTGLSPAFVIFRGLLLLPLFYYFCRWVYTMQAPSLSMGQA